MNYKNIGDFCVWVDERLINLLSDISQGEFDQKLSEDTRSLRNLCEHLITSYELFFHEPTAEVYRNLISNVQGMNKKDLLAYWIMTAKKFAKEIHIKDENPIELSIGNNRTLELSRSDNILSYFHHNTYHWGQLVTIFRLITHKPAINLDYGSFLMETN